MCWCGSPRWAQVGRQEPLRHRRDHAQSRRPDRGYPQPRPPNQQLSGARQKWCRGGPAAVLVFGWWGVSGDATGQDRTDAQLLAAHVAGDRFAFEELFNRYQPPAVPRWHGSPAAAPRTPRDALQDAMLSAHRSAHRRSATTAPVSSWLLPHRGERLPGPAAAAARHTRPHALEDDASARLDRRSGTGTGHRDRGRTGADAAAGRTTRGGGRRRHAGFLGGRDGPNAAASRRAP